MIDENTNKFAQMSEPDRSAADQSGIAQARTAPIKTTDAAEPDVTKTATSGGAKDASTGVDVQAYIGRQLRAVYDDVAKQPIPDRFLALMKQLEEQTLKK